MVKHMASISGIKFAYMKYEVITEAKYERFDGEKNNYERLDER